MPDVPGREPTETYGPAEWEKEEPAAAKTEEEDRRSLKMTKGGAREVPEEAT